MSITVMNFLTELMGIANVYAAGDSIGSKILVWAGSIGGALVAVALIFSIVKDAMGYIKGSGSNSIGKIIGKIILLVFMIGVISLAASGGFTGLSKTLGNKATEGTEQVIKDVGL